MSSFATLLISASASWQARLRLTGVLQETLHVRLLTGPLMFCVLRLASGTCLVPVQEV